MQIVGSSDSESAGVRRSTCTPAGILWDGQFFNYVSYSKVAREYVKALYRTGADVAIHSVDKKSEFNGFGGMCSNDRQLFKHLLAVGDTMAGPTIRVLHMPPHVAQRVESHAFVAQILYTTWEGDNIEPAVLKNVDAFDQVWVPSLYNKSAFVLLGIDSSRVGVVHHGVDRNVYYPMRRLCVDRRGARLTFFGMSDSLWRKGWDIVVKAFSEEFAHADDAELVIKRFRKRHKTWRDFFSRVEGSIPYERIRYYRRNYPENQLPRIFEDADVFVSGARAEGFGMCTLEAMAMGLLVIACPWSGHAEFLNEHNCLPVDVGKIVQRRFSTLGGQEVTIPCAAEPDAKSMRQQMRRAYSSIEEFMHLRMRGLRDARQGFTWDGAVTQMRGHLTRMGFCIRERACG